jgi:carbonic anhydrase/acetyltransferase-like protein (isoleucine patch superfamily)
MFISTITIPGSPGWAGMLKVQMPPHPYAPDTMVIYEYEGKRPRIGEGVHIFDSATIIGDVMLGNNCSVYPGAVIRGDYGRIEIGEGSSIQDHMVVHVRKGEVTRIGSYAILGHGCVIHNCSLGDFCTIGMNAVVSDGARLGDHVMVGEGAVVRQGQMLENGDIAVGVPAKVIGKVSAERREERERDKDNRKSVDYRKVEY